MSDAGLDPVLAEYEPMGAAVLPDEERWPLLVAAGAERLRALREHPAAPRWTHACGDRLDSGDLDALDALAAALAAGSGRDAPPGGAEPAWVGELVARVHATAPRYRRLVREGRAGGPGGRAPDRLADVAPVARADLVADLAGFVPVDVPLARVLEGTSSGSTGAALVVPLHPRALAAEVVLLRHLLEGCGVRWEPSSERAGLVSLLAQPTAFTYASVMSAFGQAAMARLTLHPSAWRRPQDARALLEALDPQVVSTTPWPLAQLCDLADAGADLHPLALVSGAAQLPAGLRRRATEAFGVPVLDLYGLRETGPVAVCADGAGVHVVVPRRVHVEVLDPSGAQVAPGVRGEVVVTVDENPHLPLLRYRTGDTARLVRVGGRPALAGLQGRPAVALLSGSGERVESVTTTQLLQAHGLRGWHLHQDAAGAVVLRTRDGDGDAAAARASLQRLLGLPVALGTLDAAGQGPGSPARRTTCDLPGGAPA
ncbi:AMP-binding protein [Quadrisphaera setariae]|uniref:AMP-binding protein n=1 Tax=Quadrisphaera setariae TaxID=2593304 RepID=A0A5C8Z4P4_9ACTN|nr:AMP-binding protein [Quadrisphaera setariae]TXR52239.1 AMP-binding protein [Quadrisphaera setariae]